MKTTSAIPKWIPLGLRPALLGLLLASFVGCGGGEFATVPVSGKVTYQGKPVEGGSVTFRPLATGGNVGKPASGTVQADGSYTLGTYADGDGAVVGKHQVLYSPPYIEPQHEMKPGEKLPQSPWHGLAPTVREVEVTDGGSTIDIELGPNR